MNTTPTMQQSKPLRPEVNVINIFDYIAVMIRRWKIIAFALLIVLIIVAFKTFTMKPIYEAYSTVHINQNNTTIMQMTPIYWRDTTAEMNTEIQIMKSRSVAEKVAQRLHSNWQVSDKSDGLTFKILEFTSTAKKPFYRIKLTSADAYEMNDENGKLVGHGQSGILMIKDGLSLLINDIKGKNGDSFELNLLPLEDAASQIQGGFNASLYGKDINIIKTSYMSTDPVVARDMLNTFVQAYIEQTIVSRTEESSRTVSFIDDQIKNLRGNLDTAEKDLQSYKSKTGMVKLDDEAQVLINKISEMEKKRTEATLQKKQLEFARNARRRISKNQQEM